MFCGNCGKEIENDIAFCAYCGAKVLENAGPVVKAAGPAQIQAQAQIQAGAPPAAPAFKSAKGRKGKRLAGAAVVGALALGVAFGAYSAISNSGRNYAYKAMQNSRKAYAKELNEFVNQNLVAKTLKDTLGGSNEQILDMPGNVRLTVSDDQKSKVLRSELRADYLGKRLQLFISDSRMVGGFPGLMFLEANPKALGSDLKLFAEHNLDYLGLEVEDSMFEILDAYDLSYSRLKDGSAVTESSDYKQWEKRYLGVMKNLMDQAEYEKIKTEVKIGDKTVKANQFTLTADDKIINNWLEKVVLPAVKDDKELQKYIGTYGTGQMAFGDLTTAAYGSGMDRSQRGQAPTRQYDADDSYDDFIEGFEGLIEDLMDEVQDESIELALTGTVYKGVIVGLEIGISGDSIDEKSGFKVTALGEAYRLNDIYFEAYDGYYEDPSWCRFAGDHIGSEVFTSTINLQGATWEDDEKATVTWDTTMTEGNLKIRADGETLKMTAAVDEGGVIFEYDSYFPYSYSIAPLNEVIALPEETVLLREVTMEEIIEEFSAVLGLGGLY